MRFQHIIEALYKSPLDITPAGFESIDAIVRPHLLSGSFPQIKSGGTDIFGAPLPDMLQWMGNIALITINGPLLQHASLLDKSCGAVSYDDIREALEEAVEAEARGILLYVNSPGGQHTGCGEVAADIAQINEDGGNIIAFTDTQMASAAYYLCAGCTRIYAAPSSMVGSIGSLMGYIDVSKSFEMQGLKAVLFTSGSLKGAGSRGVPLSDEQSDYLQGLVDQAANSFKSHVLNYRPAIEESAMEGQIFFAEEAKKAGLIDATMDDLEEVLDQLR